MNMLDNNCLNEFASNNSVFYLNCLLMYVIPHHPCSKHFDVMSMCTVCVLMIKQKSCHIIIMHIGLCIIHVCIN